MTEEITHPLCREEEIGSTVSDCETGSSPSSDFAKTTSTGVDTAADKFITKPAIDDVCCGPPAGPASSPSERPGYRLEHFVEDFVQTPAGSVPRVKTTLDSKDLQGTFLVRCGIGRNDYKIAPGLYCTGNPGPESPVLVTANYKLSFDSLRGKIDTLDTWLLVLDTRGINVWCAAGKGTFSTGEVIHRVKMTGLEKIVQHRRLVLPQLSATGVAAHQVKKGCGFKVVWGPVRAEDLKSFLDSGMKVEESMRRVTFSLPERLVLIPVELSFIPKYLLWSIIAIFLLSGIGVDIFSFKAAWFRGLMLAIACAAGIFAGAMAAPALLPWIPMRSFSLKGAITGLAAGLVIVWLFRGWTNGWESLALLVCTGAISSYLAMNFTGSTPFTSPSGVEKEMRKAIPVQAAAVLVTVGLWILASFA